MRKGANDGEFMVKMDDDDDNLYDEGPSTSRPACWEQTATVEELEESD